MKKGFLILIMILLFFVVSCDEKDEAKTPEESEEIILSIDEFLETKIASKSITNGLVVAKNDDGFIINDNTNSVFVRYFNSVKNVDLNSSLVLYGSHTILNGHKLTVSSVRPTNEIKVTNEPINITDSEITNIINSYKAGKHVLKYVTLNAQVTSSNKTFNLKTDKYLIKTNNDDLIDTKLAENINKNCLLTGYIYEYAQDKLTMLVTKVFSLGDNIDADAPTIFTDANYYHYTSINDVKDLTKYFDVVDVVDGVITVTNEMIDGTIKEGKNIITLTVTDSDNNVATSSIVIYVGDYETYQGTENIGSINPYTLPSTGNSKVLVIPIAFENYPKTEEMRTRINKAFFGTSEDTGWESLQSYYQKSSYGKLNITGEVTPWYEVKESQKYYATYSSKKSSGTTLILNEALEYFADTYDYSDYDSNNDGYIDAVYLVYNAPIYGDYSNAQRDFYWAYQTYDANAYYRDYQYTKAYGYVFMGYEFFDFELEHKRTKIKINCETVIHETGHLLNLPDYYDYDDKDIYNNDGGYCSVDMMDHNFGDHGPVSKILLNWIDPVLIQESGIYQLPSLTQDGIAFVISTNPKRNKFDSIFDEYYVIDYVTFDGLNALQCKDFFKTDNDCAGVRVSLANTTLDKSNPDYIDFKYNNTDTKHKIIQLLEADYDGTFDLSVAGNLGANIYDLYHVGDIFGNNYYENFKSADGNKVPFTMEVLDFNTKYATVKITFK